MYEEKGIWNRKINITRRRIIRNKHKQDMNKTKERIKKSKSNKTKVR